MVRHNIAKMASRLSFDHGLSSTVLLDEHSRRPGIRKAVEIRDVAVSVRRTPEIRRLTTNPFDPLNSRRLQIASQDSGKYFFSITKRKQNSAEVKRERKSKKTPPCQ